jgi:hypothetical protein
MKIEIEYEENESTHASCHCYGSLKFRLEKFLLVREKGLPFTLVG